MSETQNGGPKEKWVTITTEEYESMKSTIEVLSDNDLVRQVMESKSDYGEGKYKKLSELIED